jgi:hypothetical protein
MCVRVWRVCVCVCVCVVCCVCVGKCTFGVARISRLASSEAERRDYIQRCTALLQAEGIVTDERKLRLWAENVTRVDFFSSSCELLCCVACALLFAPFWL